MSRREEILSQIVQQYGNRPLLPREVAQFRRKTTAALAVERCRGQGPAYVKDGGRVTYLPADIADHQAARRITPTPKAA